MTGREKEEKQLKKLYNSKKAHLVAVYGRRRVGKTYLINQTFKGHITFSHAGLSPVDNSKKGMLSIRSVPVLSQLSRPFGTVGDAAVITSWWSFAEVLPRGCWIT